MAGVRTATAILEARGAFAKDPKRRRADPVVSNPFPDVAPSSLDPLEVKWWHELRKQAPDGVLTGADQAPLIVAACLMAEYMSDRRGMAVAKIGLLLKTLGQFGMTPADRARLATPPRDDDGEF